MIARERGRLDCAVPVTVASGVVPDLGLVGGGRHGGDRVDFVAAEDHRPPLRVSHSHAERRRLDRAERSPRDAGEHPRPPRRSARVSSKATCRLRTRPDDKAERDLWRAGLIGRRIEGGARFRADRCRPGVVTLEALNRASRAELEQVLAGVFEPSPWIAARAAEARPFASLEAVLAAMVAVVRRASPEEQLALLRAHPDLAGRAARAGALTSASAAEQSSAGRRPTATSTRASAG
jgi:hypothetical protein